MQFRPIAIIATAIALGAPVASASAVQDPGAHTARFKAPRVSQCKTAHLSRFKAPRVTRCKTAHVSRFKASHVVSRFKA